MLSRTARLSSVAAAAAVALLAAGCGGSSTSSSASTSSSSSGSTAAASSGSGSTGTSGKGNTASAPGITATEIKIGGHTPLTGPAAPGYDEIDKAAQAYFDLVNANGGVDGRKITFDYKDDGYNPANTATVVRQLVTQDNVYGILAGLGTPTHEAVVDYLNSQRVPDLFVASGCLCWNMPKQHPFTFGWQPDYYIEGKILGQYVKQHFAGKKVGYLLQNDDFGKDGARGLDTQIPQSQVVDREYYVPTNTNLGPQIAKLKGAGVQVLVSFTIPAFTAITQLTAAQLSFQPQYVVSNVGSDPTTLGGLLKSFSKGKADSRLLEGMVSDTYMPLTTDASNSWIQLFTQVLKKYAPGVPLDGNSEYGMAQAYTFVRAMKAAGQNPTRLDVVKAIEANKGLDGPGLVPFRYSASSHAGFTGVQVFQITGGQPKLVGTPLTTDDANGPITPYSGQQPTAPSNGIGG